MGDSGALKLLQLQINLLSARDLASVSRSMQTYAVVYINPELKMTTQVDITGHNSPEWAEKFTFRVVPDILYSDFCTIVVEIYARSWARDVLVGSVQVPAHQIIPANPTAQTRRAVALQIRKSSGRPQGILNVAVALTEDDNNTAGSTIGAPDDKNRDTRGEDTVRRRYSAFPDDDRSGSLVNGPGFHGGSMCSSVGPSASVVAAEVARGLHTPSKARRRRKVRDDGESSILLWADEETEEAMNAKIERWKTELKMNGRDGEGTRRNRKRRHSESRKEGKKEFRCFGNGFEFTIVCGGSNNNNNQVKKVHDKKLNRTLSDESSFV